MPSPRPIKEFREKIKVNPKSVKVVNPMSPGARAQINAMENTRVLITKSGALAKRSAALKEAQALTDKRKVVTTSPGVKRADGKRTVNVPREKPKVVTINSNMGGLTGTKKIGGGGGFFGLPKNR